MTDAVKTSAVPTNAQGVSGDVGGGQLPGKVMAAVPAKPILRVQVGPCEVTYIKPAERKDELAEARELLERYGRLDRIEVIKMFEATVRNQGKDVAEVPLVVMTVTKNRAEELAMAYVTGEQAGRIEVNVEGQMMQLRPEVVHFDGLDASKEVSEADPHRYLVMPYQARMGDPSGGLLIPDGEFDKWVKGIPRQERTAS